MIYGLIMSALFLCWLVLLGYKTIVVCKENNTRWNIKVLIVLLIISYVSCMIYSYNHMQYATAKAQKEMHNFQMLQIIAMIAGDTAGNIETFLDLVHAAGEDNDPDRIYSAWNDVLKNGTRIMEYSGGLSAEHMGELEDDTRDLKQILSNQRFALYAFNEQFLKNQTGFLTPEETENIEAIRQVYLKISEGIQSRYDNGIEEGLIDSLRSHM